MPKLSSFVPASWPLRVLALAAIGLVAYVGVYRLFFQGEDLAREKGNRIVAEEQVQAEGQIVDNAMSAVKEREVFREHVTTIVRESNQEVNDAWTGEQVGEDVDAAGAAALCSLHDSLCRPAPSPAVQPIR